MSQLLEKPLICIPLLIALIDTSPRNNFLIFEDVYYLKQVFHLLCDKSVTPVEALLNFSLISLIIVQYDNMIS